MNFPDPKPSPVDLKLKSPRSWSTLAWKPIEKEVDLHPRFSWKIKFIKGSDERGSAWISVIPRGASCSMLAGRRFGVFNCEGAVQTLPRMSPTGWNTFEKDRAFCLEHAQMPLTARTFWMESIKKKRQSRSISKSQKFKTSSYHKYSGDSNNCLTFKKKSTPPKYMTKIGDKYSPKECPYLPPGPARWLQCPVKFEWPAALDAPVTTQR